MSEIFDEIIIILNQCLIIDIVILLSVNNLS